MSAVLPSCVGAISGNDPIGVARPTFEFGSPRVEPRAPPADPPEDDDPDPPEGDVPLAPVDGDEPGAGVAGGAAGVAGGEVDGCPPLLGIDVGWPEPRMLGIPPSVVTRM